MWWGARHPLGPGPGTHSIINPRGLAAAPCGHTATRHPQQEITAQVTQVARGGWELRSPGTFLPASSRTEPPSSSLRSSSVDTQLQAPLPAKAFTRAFWSRPVDRSRNLRDSGSVATLGVQPGQPACRLWPWPSWLCFLLRQPPTPPHGLSLLVCDLGM